MNAQAIPVAHLGRTDLDGVEINWPAWPSDLRARRLPPKEPKGHWAYQGEAMNNVVKEFRQADRGKLTMAYGTGKTLTPLFIREKLPAERTLVLMPSLQLMKQTIGAWRRNKKVDFDFLPVCSDETVSKMMMICLCRAGVIRASRSRETASATANEATPFVVENTVTRVSCSHGAWVIPLRNSPHRSTTLRPSR